LFWQPHQYNCKWIGIYVGTTNSKPPGPIIMIDQSEEILSRSQVQSITLCFGGAQKCNRSSECDWKIWMKFGICCCPTSGWVGLAFLDSSRSWTFTMASIKTKNSLESECKFREMLEFSFKLEHLHCNTWNAPPY